MSNAFMKQYNLTLKEIPISSLKPNPAYEDKLAGVFNQDASLRASLKAFGLEQPLAVSEIRRGVYRIVDGHRRYWTGITLGWRSIPCMVYPKLTAAEWETLRFRLHNARPWTEEERQIIQQHLADNPAVPDKRKHLYHVLPLLELDTPVR